MKVFVQNLEGVKYDIDGVELDQTVDKLKYKIQTTTGISPGDQTLIYLGQSMESGTLEQFGLIEGSTINLVHRSNAGW